MPSGFMLSSVLAPDRGDALSPGERGECPLGVCEADGPVESWLSVPLSETFVSEARLDNLAPPMLFFCLNFSSQLELLAFEWLSLLPTVAAQTRAFSLMAASVSGRPCFCEFRTQLDRARSISGNLPFDLLTGDVP